MCNEYEMGNKTPLLRPPFVPSKSGLNSGVVLIVNSSCCETFKSENSDQHNLTEFCISKTPSRPQQIKDHLSIKTTLV